MWLAASSAALHPFQFRVAIPEKKCQLTPFPDLIVDASSVDAVLNCLDDHDDIAVICLLIQIAVVIIQMPNVIIC
jgi:hypothetical protein